MGSLLLLPCIFETPYILQGWIKKLKNQENWKKIIKPNPNKKNRAKLAKSLTKPKKPSQNRFEPVFVLKKPNRNRSVWTGFGFLKKIKFQFNYFFLIKTEPNQKWSPLILFHKPAIDCGKEVEARSACANVKLQRFIYIYI